MFLLGQAPLFPEKTSEMDAALQQELGITNTVKTETSQSTEEPVDPRFSQQAQGDSFLWLFVKVILVLGILAGSMFYSLRFLSASRDAKFPVKGLVDILSSVPIGQNKSIQIVDISGQLLVLGVSDYSINLITEITSVDEKNRILQMKESFEPSAETFLSSFLNSLKKTHGSREEKEERPSFSDIRKRQLERLEKIRLEKDNLKNELEGLSP